jgi:hypothetical protein
VYRVYLFDELPDNIALDGMVLAPEARLTDFVSTAYARPGLLMSPRARARVSSLALGSHRMYPATVVAGETTHAHFLLMIPPTPWTELGFVSATMENTWDPYEPLRQVYEVEDMELLIEEERDWAPIEFEFEGEGARTDLLRVPGPWRAFGSDACFDAIRGASLTGLR